MNKGVRKALVLTIGVFIVLMFITGCEEENASTAKGKIRFMAVENKKLQKEIDRQKDLVNRQKDLVKKCEKEKKAFAEQANKGIEELMSSALDDLAKEVQRLQEENQVLKEKVSQLEKVE